MDERLDRAAGALYGLALGDALGMATQDLPRRRALEVLAGVGSLRDFADAPQDNPISAGMVGGRTTDDTDQAMIVARLLIDGHGAVDVSQLAEQLLAWEGRMAETGSLDLLGPSTRQALTAYGLGAPITTTGRHGTTNGAAMRIAPVGVAAEAAPLASLVDRVVEVDRLTHDTGLAHAGAAAVATVVSLGIDGVPFAAAVASAIEAADLAQEQGHYAAGPAVSERINWAIEVVGRARRTAGIDAAMDLVDRVVGTSLATQESVPAAFAVAALAGDDPWEACRWASGVGGDCDTIAAMVGAMLGSSLGARAFSTRAKDRLNEANSLDIEAVAAGLLDVRDKRAGRG